ncbi:hypothetical protein DPEC_G00184710 [Dallia pectoralis]|uniref:Uncharacterized protein n=1 Tax=Dallia pectoralis TaxID=75939 RepID=A0ACC2GAZ1_DALPE|nr:hypothetical protein DPEC_G00184710 [Dallia pectoralis]
MSESGNAREVREQIAGYQYEDQDLQSEAQLLVDSSETRCLKETNEAIRQSLTDLQGKLNKDDNAPEGPRRSERIRNPTEKMRALQYDEAKKVEKRLLAMYEQWKLHTREARDQLKTYMSESQLWLLIEQLKKDKEDLMNVYYEIRNLITPSADIRRRVDTCESMTTDTSTEKGNLRDVKKNEASALNTQTVNEHNNHKSEQWKVKTPCILCQDSRHQLHACSKFTDMVLGERRNYIREKKLCYGCLKPGHSARDCRHRHSCDQCKGKHPTALHDDNYKREGSESEPPETNQSAAATSLSIAGEGSSNTSMVIPVWVSSKNDPTAEKLVYALLDTQSDTTFIDQDVSDVLNVDKFPVKLKLTTMSGRDTVLTSEGVSGLRVRGYSSSIPVDLPVAYTKDCIPVNRSHIPTCETAKQWSHLAEIVDEIQPLKDCAVGLLIGYNCSRAMAPRQVLLGGDEEPYAKIQLSSVPKQWRYVPTNENPAPHASRGLTAGEFLSSTWLTGPKFVWEQEIRLATDDEPELTVGDLEVRSSVQKPKNM